jgi:hypothetical protein
VLSPLYRGLGFNHVEAQPHKGEEEKLLVLRGYYHNSSIETYAMARRKPLA